MYILTDIKDVILAISDKVDEANENIIWMNGAGYGLFGQKVIEVAEIPSHIEVDKFKYIDGNFIENENYINSTTELHELKKRLEATEQALLQIMMEGVI